jgi:hypothetical protein
MKGQAVFEFVVAAVIFFAIVFYMITFLDFNVLTYSEQSRLNNLEAKALEMSEYLVHVELAREWPVLSYSSIDGLNQSCNSDYTGVLDRFDTGGNEIKIQVSEGGLLLADCEEGMAVPDIQKAEVERFAVSENSSIINVRVVIW